MKRLVKRSAGYASVVNHTWSSPPEEPLGCVLVYHRVAEIGFVDSAIDDWNVPPGTFARQIEELSASCECVPLLELPARLATRSPGSKPLVALTFDDGYANFCTEALPILERYQVPATVGIVTSVVGSVAAMPFDRWSQRNHQKTSSDCWRPLSWGQIEHCLDSSLVTLASHSHEHKKAAECSPDDLEQETHRSREILLDRYGAAHAAAYMYPYGCSRLGYVTTAYCDAVARAGYSLAATTDLGMFDADVDLLRAPRIEAHAVDATRVLRAKVAGVLGPYRAIDRLRQRKRAL